MKLVCMLASVLILSLAITASATVRGVKPADQSLYSGATFQCRDGSRNLPLSFVNDDYCDCEDGSDEPGTSACPKSTFWCNNKGFKGFSIPASRVNDGICDCCDGSDEYSGIATCADTCVEQGKEAMKGLLEQIAAIEAGSKLRAAWAAEGQEKHAKNTAETANLKASLDEKESFIAEARELLEKEEAAEKAERQRLEEEREKEVQRIQAEFAAKHPPVAAPVADQQQQQQAPATEQPAQQQQQTQIPPADTAAATTGGSEAAAPAEEFFPYPKEYAFPQGDAAAHDDNADLDDGHDPVEEHVDDHLDDHVDEPVPPPAPPAPSADQPVLPPPVSFTSETAEAARKALRKLEDEKRDLQKKHDDLKNTLDYDFGPNKELYALLDKCFEYKANQYVYEVCPFNKAEQKENGRGTSLGRFEKYDSSKQVMSFTNGQTCWNGPARSLSVKLECGGETRLLAVEEPGKCVYATTLQTPALCDPEYARTLRANLAAEFADAVPPVHTEL